MTEFVHTPVLLNEVTTYLQIRPDGTYLDCTTGEGGHAYEVGRQLSSEGTLFMLDVDAEVLAGEERVRAILVVRAGTAEVRARMDADVRDVRRRRHVDALPARLFHGCFADCAKDPVPKIVLMGVEMAHRQNFSSACDSSFCSRALHLCMMLWPLSESR